MIQNSYRSKINWQILVPLRFDWGSIGILCIFAFTTEAFLFILLVPNSFFLFLDDDNSLATIATINQSPFEWHPLSKQDRRKLACLHSALVGLDLCDEIFFHVSCRKNSPIFKCDMLALALLRIEIFVLLPSALRQNSSPKILPINTFEKKILQKNTSKKSPKKIQKISKQFFKKFLRFWKYPIPYIALGGLKPFRACLYLNYRKGFVIA